MRTARWKRSADVVLAGSGGRAGAAFRSTDRAVCNELRCVSARDDYDCSDGPAVTTFHDHEFARSPAPSASILRPRRSLVEARACMVRKNADFSYALPERRVTIRNPCVRNGPGGIWRTRHDSNV